MAIDYTNTFKQLGAELKNLRKLEVLWEHSHLATDATYSKRLTDAVYSSSVTEEKIAKDSAGQVQEDEVTPGVSGLHGTALTKFEGYFFPVLDAELTTNENDKSVGAIRYVYDSSLTNGQIAILERQGRLGALRAAMIADSETIRANVVAEGSLTAKGTNLGKCVKTSFTGEDHCLAGVITIACVSDAVEAVGFSIIHTPTLLPMGMTTSYLQGDNPITLGRTFQDGNLGISLLQLDLDTISVTDPDSLSSAESVVNPYDSDSDKGKVYLRLTRMGAAPIWQLEWFLDSGHTDRIALAQFDGTSGSEVVSMTGSSGMQVNLTINKTTANTALPVQGNTSDMMLDICSPRIGDQWTLTITNSEAGNFATKIAHRYRVSLNSVVNPGQTIDDSYAASVTMT